MGRPVLPSIAKLEDVLDLLTNPDKYVKYLNELRQIHAETANILQLLDTKQKADVFLSEAQDVKTETLLFKQKVEAEIAQTRKELQLDLAQCDKEKAQVYQEGLRIENKSRDLINQEKALTEVERVFADHVRIVNADLVKQTQELAQKQLTFERACADFNTKLEKFAALR